MGFVTKFCALISLLAILSLANGRASSEGRKHYIVYMGSHSFKDSESVVTANHKMLDSIMDKSDERKEDTTVYHYTKAFRGFSAMLTPDQAQRLAESDSVISIFESKMNRVHTTRSWDFLGINALGDYNHQLLMSRSYDVIVGVIDTGVWPESKSFDDYGLGPVPSRFKGLCSTGQNFTSSNCNRKIIGARFYYKGFELEEGPLEAFGKPFFRSPRDADGHGSHTASTIAGAEVPNAALYDGIANGTARGGAPWARLAIYKACWFGFCEDADLLSAMDDAIDDGVDVISMSLGPGPPQPSYFDSVTSIGSFHAFQRGVLVSASAGNSFDPGTVTNAAPWVLTVAASTMDRDIPADIYLINAPPIRGFSINSYPMSGYNGLIAGSAAAAAGVPSENASFCEMNTLDPSLTKGKIVVCTLRSIFDDRTSKSVAIKEGGGVGIILIDPLAPDIGFQFVLPGTLIGLQEAEQLERYMASYTNPYGRISLTRTISNVKPAPQMAMFSSMGPNAVSPDVIKPDVTAPGVNVLAAWSPVAVDDTAGRPLDYNIISGTSMSCPHVSALAAIVKSYHPSWSPSAIKSAIMTTAKIQDNTRSSITRHPNNTRTTPFDYGSGQIDASAAVDPGLVYDFNTEDIIDFLCSSGATPEKLKNLTGETTYCKNSTTTATYNLNYPSIGVSSLNGTLSVVRTVTYVGKGSAVYKATIEAPEGVYVTVTPNELRFDMEGEKMSYRVDFKAYKKRSDGDDDQFVFGALTWSDGIHVVRSPIGLNIV
ncbi:subtilisin-like serine-protease S [Andrographis paniculata]|uniref:subtilisin-like serine-protease S n=1 Tax=Andrographis paniculata TaxID=175694 RepID=UPI0021E6E4A7|nr:subtilisin-like serine-protease S [Andrographis paniculata]